MINFMTKFREQEMQSRAARAPRVNVDSSMTRSVRSDHVFNKLQTRRSERVKRAREFMTSYWHSRKRCHAILPESSLRDSKSQTRIAGEEKICFQFNLALYSFTRFMISLLSAMLMTVASNWTAQSLHWQYLTMVDIQFCNTLSIIGVKSCHDRILKRISCYKTPLDFLSPLISSSALRFIQNPQLTHEKETHAVTCHQCWRLISIQRESRSIYFHFLFQCSI